MGRGWAALCDRDCGWVAAGAPQSGDDVAVFGKKVART